MSRRSSQLGPRPVGLGRGERRRGSEDVGAYTNAGPAHQESLVGLTVLAICWGVTHVIS